MGWGNFRKALKLVAVLPDVIEFIQTVVVVFSDSRLEPDEAAKLVKEGTDILEKLR